MQDNLMSMYDNAVGSSATLLFFWPATNQNHPAANRDRMPEIAKRGARANNCRGNRTEVNAMSKEEIFKVARHYKLSQFW